MVFYMSSQSNKLHTNRGPDSSDLMKYEEDRLKRRQEWLREQKMLKDHEKRKQKKIEEYEAERARKLKLKHSEQRSSNSSYDREHCRSKSLEELDRMKLRPNSSKVLVMSEKLQSSDGRTPLFKSSEGTPIDIIKLRQIQVDIRRNIPSTVITNEIQRNIVNPEEVILARRKGEGSVPIFEREELRRQEKQAGPVEEHQTAISIDLNREVKKDASMREPLISVSSLRNHSHSPQRQLSSQHTRHYKDIYKNVEFEHSGYKKDRFRRTRFLRRNYRERSREYELNERRTLKERELSSSHHYVQPISIPIYYESFPRPIIMGPMIPIWKQIPLIKSRLPIGNIRPSFLPQFGQLGRYRSNMQMNPRFHNIY